MKSFSYLNTTIYIFYCAYCFISYIMMSYYSVYLLIFSDIQFNHFSTTSHPYMDSLIIWSLQYFIIDTVHKFMDKRYLRHFYTHEKMHIALLIHHILGLILTLYSYYTQISMISIIALYTFEISSIFMLLHNLNIKLFEYMTLYLFWLSYFIVRILYGNMIILYLWVNMMYDERSTMRVMIPTTTMYVFLLLANNTWFYKLNRKLNKLKQKHSQKYSPNSIGVN